MKVWVVISSICSPLGFTNTKVLGVFSEEKDANQCKKNQCKNTIDNYTISVIKSKIQYSKRKYVCDFMDNLSDNIKNGYDVA